MGYVVPFMNTKGGVGKSVLARAYAVEAARAGASVLIADLDGDQRTSKRWADQRKANGFRPEIHVEVATAGRAYRMADRAEVLVIDAPAWSDRDALKMASWSTFCVIPSRANRMDDLSETVRLLHKLKEQGIESWRFGVALNALRATSAQQDEIDARAYLATAGFDALPGATRDMKDYEAVLLEGRAITETGQRELNDEAFMVVNGIAGAVFEAGAHVLQEHERIKQRGIEKTKQSERDKGGRDR